MHENEISGIIIDAAIEVHRELGPGLLESVYEDALWYELAIIRGMKVQRQQAVAAEYKGRVLKPGFRTDLIVEDKVIVELKSIEFVLPVHYKILVTYLRFTEKKLGLMLNFNVELMKDGIRRVVNGFNLRTKEMRSVIWRLPPTCMIIFH